MNSPFKAQNCPGCRQPQLIQGKGKRLFGLYDNDALLCKNCGATLIIIKNKYKLVDVQDKKSFFWRDFKNRSLTMEEWKHIADGWPVRYDMETGGYIPYKPDNYSEYDSSSKSLIDNRPFPIEPAPQTDENDKPVAQTNDIYLAELQSNSEPLNRNYLFYDDNSSDWRRHSPNHDCTLCAEGREQAGAEKIRRRIIFISLICIVAVISFVYEKPIIDIIDSLFTTLFSVMSLLGLFGIIVIIGWIIWLIRFLITKPGGLPLREGLPPKGWRTDDGGKTWHP